MRPLRIAQLSDFHLTCPTLNPFELCSKRLIGMANWLLTRKKTFSKTQVDATLPLLEDLDYVFLGGDFTTTSRIVEFEQAMNFVRKIKAPWFAIPGNHDHYTKKAHREGHFFSFLKNKPGLMSLSTDSVEAHPLSKHWWAVLVDTCRPTFGYSARGEFSCEEKLRELLEKIPARDSILLLNHYPLLDGPTHWHNLEGAKALENIVRHDPRIKAYLHGHTHRQRISDLQESGLPVVLDSGCTADAKRGSFQLLTIDDIGIEVEVYRWDGAWKQTEKEKIAWTRGLQTV